MQKGRGNDGSVESVENQKQVSHTSHRPLGISQLRRDFHIPTARASSGWKSGKPKAGFPLSHAPLATPATAVCLTEPRSKPWGLRPLQKGESSASGSLCRVSISGSRCIGIKSGFQDHSSIGKCWTTPILYYESDQRSAIGVQLLVTPPQCMRIERQIVAGEMTS